MHFVAPIFFHLMALSFDNLALVFIFLGASHGFPLSNSVYTLPQRSGIGFPFHPGA